MTKQEWFALFKHPEWQKKRLKILERDEFACVQCGTDQEMLHVHHTFYWDKEDEAPPWDYDDETLISLCESCHKDEHEQLVNLKRSFMRSLGSNGFMRPYFLERLAFSFDGSGGKWDIRADIDVLAYAIEMIIESRTFDLGRLGKARLVNDSSIWDYFEKSYCKHINQKKINNCPNEKRGQK